MVLTGGSCPKPGKNNENDVVRLGLIGCGRIARYGHAPAIDRLHRRVRCVAVADIDKPSAERLAREIGAPYHTDDYADLLRMDDIEAVVIAVPHSLHVEVTCAAAEAGKHILLEKPMGRSLSEADIIGRAVSDHGVRLMVGLNRRFLPQYCKVKEMVDKGLIGCIKLVTLASKQCLPFNGWKGSRSAAGGGVILDPGVHCFDQLSWWAGEVEEVFARSLNRCDKDLVEADALVSLRFRSGALGEVLLTASARGYRAPAWDETACVYGEDGDVSACIPSPEVRFHSRSLLGDNAGHLSSWAVPYLATDESGNPWNSFDRQMIEFVRYLRGEARNVPGVPEARAALRVVDAAYESCRSGQNVVLRDLPPST